MNRLKELRQEKGLTQQALADEMEVTKRTYIYWEKGDRQIKPEKAQQLADYFGVSVGYLLGYSEDKKIYDDEIVLEIDNHLITSSEERFQEKMHQMVLTEFVRFLADNTFFLTNDEIIDIVNHLYFLSVNHGDSLKEKGFHEVFKNPNHENYDQMKKEYSFIFDGDFERSDLEQEIHSYIEEETETVEKSQKLLKVLKSTYRERDYLD